MLTLVPTPIGNVEDITLRALRVFKEAQIILCEDTRVSKKLFSILISRGLLECNVEQKTFLSFHSHNQDSFLESLESDFFTHDIAYLSDAGMPCISDPGAKLVDFAIKNHIAFDVLPGACALNVAFSGSGIESTPFFFAGFLPHKTQERKTKILQLVNLPLYSPYSVICYESPHRILETISDIASLLPCLRLVVSKELTKLHQKRYFGTAEEMYLLLKGTNLSGEWVVILDCNNTESVPEMPSLNEQEVLMLDIPPKIKAKILSKMIHKSVKECYEALINSN